MLNKLRIYFNIWLCRLDIRDILPKEALRKIEVLENNDSLVDISEDESFFFDTRLDLVYVRNEVYHRLEKAADMLPQEIYLKIYDAYRSLEKQKESWERAFKQTRKEKGNLSAEEIKRLTRLKVADPYAGDYGGHQTGGAVDVTLCDKNGKELDLGTKVAEYNKKTKTKNPFLSDEARQNRELLKKVMMAVGFKNFPAEWWHFSYGDKLWAAYSARKTCFYGFIEKFPRIRRGNIADGLNDVAKYLNLDPQKTIFIHSISDPNESIEIDSPIYRHTKILSYLSRKEGGAKALILYGLPDLLNYLNEQGIAPKDNYIQISAKPATLVYPDISVAAQFCKAIKNGREDIINVLKGKTLISSYPGQDEQKLADFAGMKLLMPPQEQLKFNSKTRLRTRAEQDGYLIIPGVEISNLNEFDRKIYIFKNLVSNQGVDINTVRFWCKFDSQSDGKGTIILEGLSGGNITNLKQHLCNFADIRGVFPIIIEIDVNCLKNTKLVVNIGVEAVISDDVITVIGSVLQDTLNGRYISSMISPDLEKYEAVAEKSTIPAFISMQKKGYRGAVTIDVLVAYDSEKRDYVGYNIDPNARFSGGMQLLSIVQHIRKITKRKYYGVSYFNSIKDSSSLFQDIKKYATPYLYEGRQSEYGGIIPISVNDLTKTKDNKRVVQVAVVGRDYDKILKMYKHFKDNIIQNLEL